MKFLTIFFVLFLAFAGVNNNALPCGGNSSRVHNTTAFLIETTEGPRVFYVTNDHGFEIRTDNIDQAINILEAIGLKRKAGLKGIHAFLNKTANIDMLDIYEVEDNPVLAPFDKEKYPIMFFFDKDFNGILHIYARFPKWYGPENSLDNIEYDPFIYEIKSPDLIKVLGFENARSSGFVVNANPELIFRKENIYEFMSRSNKSLEGFQYDPLKIDIWGVDGDTVNGDVHFYLRSPYTIPLKARVLVNANIFITKRDEHDRGKDDDTIVKEESTLIENVIIYPKDDPRNIIKNKVSFKDVLDLQKRAHPKKNILLSIDKISLEIIQLEEGEKDVHFHWPLSLPQSENELDKIDKYFLDLQIKKGNKYAQFLMAKKLLKDEKTESYKKAFHSFLNLTNSEDEIIASNAKAQVGLMYCLGHYVESDIEGKGLDYLNQVNLDLVGNNDTLTKIKVVYKRGLAKAWTKIKGNKEFYQRRLQICQENLDRN